MNISNGHFHETVTRVRESTKLGFRVISHAFIACLLSCVAVLPSARGAHIVGGEMTYRCLGNGQYVFTMKVYRDCFSGGASFDPVAAMTIYAIDNVTNQQILFRNLQIPRGAVFPIETELNSCITVPPNICVEGTTYETGTVILPVDPSVTYVMAYQRCCRNNTISNIVEPGEAGATYTVSITPAAQLACNNSPVFTDFPPTVICANLPFFYDHSATDADGDQLVYEFCAPLLGGGVIGTADNPGNPNAFNGVMPNPAAPPAYSPVLFLGPNYSPTAPMGGAPAITIDPATGAITGTPNVQGQFVVGVCVSEYRNGVLLSTTRRDFQFNVAACEANVVADIVEDEIVGPKQFLVNSCGNKTVTFLNESFQEAYIDEYLWEFTIQGVKTTANTENVTVTFPDTGTYEGRLIVNPGSDCGDTATIFVNVFPEIVADYTFDYDTCIPGPVEYTNQSFTGAGDITGYFWDFEDGATSQEADPLHQFASAGVFDVRLIVRDKNNCTDDTVQQVTWYPLPPLLIVEPNNEDGCSPVSVTFQNLSFPVDSTYTILWDFGDGNGGTEVSPTHLYEQVGIFDVSLDITSPIGCTSSAFFPELIDIRESPVAGFDYSPKTLSTLQSSVDFTDLSQNGQYWLWEFDQFGTSYEREPSFTFPDSGRMVVKQYVSRENGCVDTALAILDIVPEIRYFLPNAFSPNQDATNEEFRAAGLFEGITNYEMTIWNRWGEMVFKTSEPMRGWNGLRMNTGDALPAGVYVYLVTFKGPRGRDYTYEGFATLLR